MVANVHGPQFSGGANIAIKCPSHTYEQMLVFYRDTLGFELVGELQKLEPYGAGNPRPTFLARNLCILTEPRLIGQRHLKLCVAGPEGRPLETIWWNGAEQTTAIRSGIDMAYTIETSNWSGETFLQLSVSDMRPRTDDR